MSHYEVLIKSLDCHAVFRKHQSRKTSMHRGKIIGDCDKFVIWQKPNKCPKGLTEEEFVADFTQDYCSQTSERRQGSGTA